MHPLLKSWKHLLSYCTAWVPVGIIFGLALAFTGRLSWQETAAITIPTTILLAVLCTSAWFVARSLPLRSAPAWKLLVNQTLAAVCASAVVLVFGHHWVELLSRFFPGLIMRFKASLPILTAMTWLIYLLAVALCHLWIAIESSRRAEILSREAELRALKAQINPHFLFNSLNSISALTSADPAKARDMCIRLSDFLRSSLRLGERTSIPFGEELALTKSYLDVEQVRFGQRLRVTQDFDAGCADCDVPPLLVQPLVENAIKHGIAMLSEGGEIAMTGQRNDHHLRVTVENPFDPDAPVMGKSGFGLVNVRNRLEARYGSAAKLEVQVDQRRYRVVLSLPCGERREQRQA
ncbi:MAG: histidine kinase [Acidobacteriaceae bacterium]|nr:histidine kinase [Acidobacteriaceae bacterium]